MKAEIHRSQLILIDMQDKLAGAMPKEVINKIIQRCELIATLAKLEDIPTLVSEQYPKGLGKTLSSMMPFLTHSTFVEKTAFSCIAEPKFNSKLIETRDHIIIAGMEAHICVLQTSIDLLQKGLNILIPRDAIGSRNKMDNDTAFLRLILSGAVASTTESLICELCKTSHRKEFREVSKILKNSFSY